MKRKGKRSQKNELCKDKICKNNLEGQGAKAFDYKLYFQQNCTTKAGGANKIRDLNSPCSKRITQEIKKGYASRVRSQGRN